MSQTGTLLTKLRATLQHEGLTDAFRKIVRYARARLAVLAVPQLSTADAATLLVRPVVLIFDHDAGGGATAYRRQLSEALLVNYDVLVTHYDTKSCSYVLTLQEAKGCTRRRTSGLNHAVDYIFTRRPVKVIVNELVGWPDLATVSSTLGALRKAGASIEFFFHDYYALCPNYTLINDSERFCDLPDDPFVCAQCLTAQGLPARVDILQWRSLWRELLSKADSLRCPDESVRTLVGRVYPEAAARIDVVPHTLPAGLSALPPSAPQGPMVIGVVGAIERHKGAALVVELAALARRSTARVVVIGTLPAGGRREGLAVTGPYARADLPTLLRRHGVTVGVIPSIWPETFCYVLHELMQLGLPVAALDMGAQGRGVRAYGKGLAVAEPSAEAFLRAATDLDARFRRGTA